MKAAVSAGVVCTAAAVVVYARWRRQQQQQNRRVLVVGSINVDLYQRTDAGAVRFGGESVRHTELEPQTHRPTHEQGRTITGGALSVTHACGPCLGQVDVLPLKGVTLPARSFVAHPKMATQPGIAARYTPGEEEAFLLTMDGPFQQKTGG
eukprot:scaffold6448_cov53-Phaeocystis_antarctica.AAC.1